MNVGSIGPLRAKWHLSHPNQTRLHPSTSRWYTAFLYAACMRAAHRCIDAQVIHQLDWSCSLTKPCWQWQKNIFCTRVQNLLNRTAAQLCSSTIYYYCGLRCSHGGGSATPDAAARLHRASRIEEEKRSKDDDDARHNNCVALAVRWGCEPKLAAGYPAINLQRAICPAAPLLPLAHRRATTSQHDLHTATSNTTRSWSPALVVACCSVDFLPRAGARVSMWIIQPAGDPVMWAPACMHPVIYGHFHQALMHL